MNEGLLVPEVDDDSRPFWEATGRSELRMQQCANCGRLRFPPRPMCPWCRSTDSAWQLMSGQGTIWSFVVAHPPLLPAYAAVAPYNVVVVALDDDPTLRLVGNVIADDGAPMNSVDPSSIQIGAAVRVAFETIAEGITLPRWVVVQGKQ